MSVAARERVGEERRVNVVRQERRTKRKSMPSITGLTPDARTTSVVDASESTERTVASPYFPAGDVTGVIGVTPTLDGAGILDEVTAFCREYIAYPNDEIAPIHALWIGHTWLCDRMDTTPRLCFVSPEKRSGKTRAQEVTGLLCANPVRVVNVTASYLFRRIDERPGDMLPTIILDETDALFGERPSESTEEIRGILNEGYRIGGHVGRTEKTRDGEFRTKDYPVFAPVCLAGIGKLPDTITDRAIMVHMKRRRPDQTVLPYRDRSAKAKAEPIRAGLAAWAEANRDILAGYGDRDYPAMPDAIQDRDADNWEPLFITAKLAGGHWPETVARIAPAMIAAQHEEPQTLGVLLLKDIRQAFRDAGTDRMFRLPLLGRLKEMDGAPWATLGRDDAGIDSNYLTRTLKAYDVPRAHTIVIDGVRQWGYAVDDFADAWTRYLPAETPPQNPWGNADNAGNASHGEEQGDDDPDELEF